MLVRKGRLYRLLTIRETSVGSEINDLPLTLFAYAILKLQNSSVRIVAILYPVEYATGAVT